jgi:hypothetical protein
LEGREVASIDGRARLEVVVVGNLMVAVVKRELSLEIFRL